MKYVAYFTLLVHLAVTLGWWAYTKKRVGMVVISSIIVLSAAVFEFTRGVFPDGWELYVPVVASIACFIWVGATGASDKSNHDQGLP